jgi:hypothetical protein
MKATMITLGALFQSLAMFDNLRVIYSSVWLLWTTIRCELHSHHTHIFYLCIRVHGGGKSAYWPPSYTQNLKFCLWVIVCGRHYFYRYKLSCEFNISHIHGIMGGWLNIWETTACAGGGERTMRHACILLKSSDGLIWKPCRGVIRNITLTKHWRTCILN